MFAFWACISLATIVLNTFGNKLFKVAHRGNTCNITNVTMKEATAAKGIKGLFHNRASNNPPTVQPMIMDTQILFVFIKVSQAKREHLAQKVSGISDNSHCYLRFVWRHSHKWLRTRRGPLVFLWEAF